MNIFCRRERGCRGRLWEFYRGDPRGDGEPFASFYVTELDEVFGKRFSHALQRLEPGEQCQVKLTGKVV